MLDKGSPRILHFLQNASLIVISLLCLPLSTFILFFSYAAQILVPQNGFRRRIRRSRSFHPKTVLVTGVGMAKGLKIARAFYQTGHRVIGADFEPHGIPVAGRVSRAISKFYTLEKPTETEGPTPYIQGLLDVVLREKVDLWVSCSGVASAIEDGQAKELLDRRTMCKSIQYNEATTGILHEKDSFIRYTESLGLPVPETHEVRSRAEVHEILHRAHGKKKSYIIKTVGVDDASRTSIRAVLPRRTMSQTYQHVSDLKITKTTPWVLQQYIKGQEYCTHSIVVNGEVKLFVACPSSELLMHYKALPESSGLGKAMLNFTVEFVRRSGPEFTGHLSFDFLVEERATERGLEQNILPIECNPRAHTAVVLFEGKKGASDMVKAYLSAFEPAQNGIFESDIALLKDPESHNIPYAQPAVPGYYWIGHDLVALLLQPLLRLMLFQITICQFLKSVVVFMEHVTLWREGTYELWDPLPAWWLYHVYWPGQFLAAILTGHKWSRINVSTTKIFGC